MKLFLIVLIDCLRRARTSGRSPWGGDTRVADSCSREGLDDGLREGLGRLRVLPGH